VAAGDVIVAYTDGSEERCSTGEVFHWPAGHTVRVENDTELILLSPQAQHGPVIDHGAAKLATV
jgi:hypothetical protein